MVTDRRKAMKRDITTVEVGVTRHHRVREMAVKMWPAEICHNSTAENL